MRYILNDFTMKYEEKYLNNKAFKDFVCQRGEINIQNLYVVATSWDIQYLSSMLSFIGDKFQIDKIKLQNQAQVTLRNIMSDNPIRKIKQE